MHNKIKVIQLIMSGTSNAGGLFFSVYGLNEELNKNVDIEICFGGEKDKKNEERKWKIFKTKIFKKFQPHSFGYMPGLINYLLNKKFDILHIHGVWSFNALVALIIKVIKKDKIKIVISPRGMLDPWSLKNSVFKKNLARKIYVNKLLRITSAFHALNNEEKKIYTFIRYTRK